MNKNSPELKALQEESNRNVIRSIIASLGIVAVSTILEICDLLSKKYSDPIELSAMITSLIYMLHIEPHRFNQKKKALGIDSSDSESW